MFPDRSLSHPLDRRLEPGLTMQALEIMKTHVVKTKPDATLSDAVDLMDLYQVTGLPVIDEAGRLCGMLTERDVVRALEMDSRQPEALAHGKQRAPDAASWRVRDYMTQPAVSVTEDTDVREAAELLLARGLKRLPVTTADGQVVGVLNRIDVCQALFEGLL